MKKKLFKLYAFCLISFTGAIALLSLLFALMQTKTLQGYIISHLVIEAKKKGLSLKIEGVKGVAPFNWSLSRVEISTEEGEKLSMEKVKLKIAVLPLFQKKLSIGFFTVDKMDFSFKTSKQKILFKEIPSFTLPFDFSTKTLKIKELLLEDLSSNQTLLLSITGKAKVNESLQEMQLDLLVRELYKNNDLQIELLSSKKKDLISGNVALYLEKTSSLSAFFELPVETALQSSISCSGKWSFWEAINSGDVGTPLSFNLHANIETLEVEELPFLNRSWVFQSNFFLWPDLSSYSKNCSLESDWIRFLGRISLSSSFIPITASAVITLKNLSEMDTVLSYPLSGEVVIKTALSQTDFLFSAKCPNLGIGEETFSPAYCSINSSLVENIWEGKALIELKNETLPWKGSLEFLVEDKNCDITDILIETESAKISGAGYVDPFANSWGGSFFILAEELRLFRKLFPASDLEGSLGGRLSLKGKGEDLSFASNLLFKNVRYQSSLVDSICVEADIQNILVQPGGTLSLECENLFVKGGELEKLHFKSDQIAESTHAFSLEAMGEWKEEFSLSSNGYWTKDAGNWSVSIENLEGLLFTKPFKMDPFKAQQTDKSLTLEKFSLEVGEGSFFLEGSFEPSRVSLNTVATHLPLDIFSLFYPTVTLNGMISFQGAFVGSQEETGGTFLASLEEVNFSQMKAKGSLQLHVTPTSMQVHSHVYATENQFLDWTGSFPLKYSYEPFQVSLDKEKPVSSEATMQGAIEEIFDFLQTASQKTSGWVTSHLFLSGDLEKPFLLGEAELQSGRYENYSTGTRLKNIETSVRAEGKTLSSEYFTAHDSDKGSITGNGTLFLQPEGKFPFEIETELKELHLIKSEMLDATASGKLFIEGNKERAKASGALQVNKALFSIADALPIEVPSIPVKHINKPIHLQRSEVIIPAVYPMDLDLDLSIQDTILIKGKGLESEWTGGLTLTGTPLSPTTRGSLTLKKGEFKFSGKTFTLMSGDLFFGQEAYLKLSGQLQIQGTMITVSMQGPLRSPRLTFQSSPYLPTSSILSLILFNKDISEISPLQTIQLAQVIMSMSGTGGPDVLEAIRKSIGIDRLSIAGKDGTEEIAVQIGWYLTRGITVSLSQSATSSDIKVEVDLKNGFIFEAETQNQEEGKFSLKWNKNY